MHYRLRPTPRSRRIWRRVWLVVDCLAFTTHYTLLVVVAYYSMVGLPPKPLPPAARQLTLVPVEGNQP